jgi:hypothetical protein
MGPARPEDVPKVDADEDDVGGGGASHPRGKGAVFAGCAIFVGKELVMAVRSNRASNRPAEKHSRGFLVVRSLPEPFCVLFIL